MGRTCLALTPAMWLVTTWDIDVLPVVESTPLYRAGDSLAAPDTGRFLNEANLSWLEQQYDIVIYFYSKYAASGAPVANDPYCGAGARRARSEGGSLGGVVRHVSTRRQLALHERAVAPGCLRDSLARRALRCQRVCPDSLTPAV